MVKRVPGLKVTDFSVRFSCASISSARTWRVNSYVFWLIGFWIKYAILPFCCFGRQLSNLPWGMGRGFWRSISGALVPDVAVSNAVDLNEISKTTSVSWCFLYIVIGLCLGLFVRMSR